MTAKKLIVYIRIKLICHMSQANKKHFTMETRPLQSL